MNRNQIIVLVSQMGETRMKTRRVISMIPLGKGKKVRVVGHSCQVSTLSKGQSGRKKHATGKAACVAHAMFLSDTIMVAVVTTGFGRKKKRRIYPHPAAGHTLLYQTKGKRTLTHSTALLCAATWCCEFIQPMRRRILQIISGQMVTCSRPVIETL